MQTIEKNILDLEYQKNLTIATTALLLLCTYFIGVSIALITQQISLDNPTLLLSLFFLSLFFLFFSGRLFLSAQRRLRQIPFALRQLKHVTL